MSKAVINQATPCANTVCVTVLNDSDKQPTLYIDDTATLAVTLINATGSPIQLPGCTLGIVFNALNVDGTACKIELQNWAFSSSKYSLSLKFSGTELAIEAQTARETAGELRPGTLGCGSDYASRTLVSMLSRGVNTGSLRHYLVFIATL